MRCRSSFHLPANPMSEKLGVVLCVVFAFFVTEVAGNLRAGCSAFDLCVNHIL